MPTWIVSADQRRGNPEHVRAAIGELTQGVHGLVVTMVHAEKNDGGRFRDFIPVAHVASEDLRVLEWLAEELVDALGWTVDIRSADVLAQDDL